VQPTIRNQSRGRRAARTLFRGFSAQALVRLFADAGLEVCGEAGSGREESEKAQGNPGDKEPRG